ncbi:MAG: HEPN domain-containing protein [Candidatus Tectomicrobia bacterium]|uniref:HEPN domain-containing protein n=1 Tax=Tectimicrobiota bacterium TaxID=2528274 RepID=A0A932FV73_UNCTE|nr:HEPN domain-containing protein [Candidatus Tectomicrobia bacterium]
MTVEEFLAKAEESLAGAESEFANGRYNNCANRCYYACFQAAVQALLRAGIQPNRTRAEWRHAFVQAQFVGHLINRRKQYPAALRDVLARTLILRQTADYEPEGVMQAQALRALRRAREFLEAIRTRGEETT